MDFISNLIKRPVSLVVAEASAETDKTQISPALPNPTANNSDNDQKDEQKESKEQNDSLEKSQEIKDQPQETQEQCNTLNNPQDTNNHQEQLQAEQHRPLSLCSSLNGNFTDFIGVPEELLGEFDDFLPPPPPILSGSDLLSPTEDNNNLQSQTPSPPPPPLTPSMMASQTIDELLSEISDNLTLAGINDEVLSIASPPQKTELSPLASKASLNNSKSLTPSSSLTNSQLQTPKTPTNNGGHHAAAAGTAAATSPAVFEANSTLHKFHVDPELATGLFEDQQQQHSANDIENTSGVNKSSNKFVGLTEFDEAKIPELPGDLNPNIEEQYNVTFEECFIPTLTAKLASKERTVEKTHLLLPSEVDNASMSSANDTFADCQDGSVDERDPLANTFAEQPTLNTTTDGDCYESAIQDEFKVSLADVTMDVGQIGGDEIEVIEEKISSSKGVDAAQPPLDCEEDEPMDVDMNVTMEMIQNSAENIQNVEKVLQHAENILQHLGEKTLPPDNNVEIQEDENEVKIIGSLAKPTETSKMTFVINAAANVTVDVDPLQHLEMEQAIHDVSLNKSIELPMNKSKTISSECVITAVNNDLSSSQKEEKQTSDQVENLNITTETAAPVTDNKNLTINTMNSSISSNASCKSPNPKTESKLNLTTSMSSSTGSLKSSAPNSPSFPIKPTLQGSSFPKSPKTRSDSNKPTFLEKSDYMTNLESKLGGSQESVNNFNGTFVEPQPVKNKNRLTFGVDTEFMPSSQSVHYGNTERNDCAKTAENVNNFNGTFVEPQPVTNKNRLTFGVDAATVPDCGITTDNKRLTFNVQSGDTSAQSEMPTNNETTISKDKIESRRTFNIPSEEQQQSPMDTSFAPMDVDDNQISQNTTMPMTESFEPTESQTLVEEERSQSPALSNAALQQRSQSPALSNLQQRSQSPALPSHPSEMKQRSQSPALSSAPVPTSESPPLPTINNRSISPPLPTMQHRSDSPPLPTMQQKSQEHHYPIEIKEERTMNISQSPPLPNAQKRPPIHGFAADVLSAKEQSNIKIKDEKDVYVEKSTPSPMEEMFTAVSATSTTLTNSSGFSAFDQSSLTSSAMSNTAEQQFGDDEFQSNSNLILNPCDFDYLLTKGNNNTPVDRSSLLLKFDPLLGVPVPVNQGQQPTSQQQLHLQIPTNNLNNNPCLSPTIEEDEFNESTNRSFVVDNARQSLSGGRAGPALSSSAKLLKERSQEVKQQLQQQQHHSQQIKRQLPQPGFRKNATMSVDVIKDMSLDNNDCNKTFENSNSTQPDDKQINYKMDELEKKVKNEVLKTEDIEKKLKDAEQREEALIKRITEKDKTVAKMNGVIEAYEKAIAELIAEKEQLIQNYEKQLAEVKADRDSNYHHLTSLETTFSDLHVKYEKSKEMTCQLKGNEENLIAESRKNAENLRLQEQRYDKMKNHAMQQLEIANKKLECLTREHSMETTKLKALLKKEEIARSSMSEQLAQKSKENAELVKICDELISGQGS